MRWLDVYVVVTVGAYTLSVAALIGWLIDRWPDWSQRAEDFRDVRRLDVPRQINQVRRDPSPQRRLTDYEWRAIAEGDGQR